MRVANTDLNRTKVINLQQKIMINQEFTWPEELQPVIIGERKFFRIEDPLLSHFGLKMHVKKKGYKHLDKIIETNGTYI